MLNIALQMRGKNIDLTESIKAHLQKRANKLEKYNSNILNIQVEVRNEEGVDEDALACKVNIQIPKHTLHKEQRANDLHVAIDDVFTVMERELKDVNKKEISKRRKDKEAHHAFEAQQAEVEEIEEDIL